MVHCFQINSQKITSDKIFDLALIGMVRRKIVAIMNTENIPSPPFIFVQKKSDLFSRLMVIKFKRITGRAVEPFLRMGIPHPHTH